MKVHEYTQLCLKVMRVSNFINFLGKVLGRYSGRSLTFLIVEGNAARGIVFGDPDAGIAHAFLEDYRRARKRVLKWLGGAFLCAIGAGTMILIAPQFFDQASQGFVSGTWPK